MKLYLLTTVQRSDDWCIVRAERKEDVRQALNVSWWNFHFDRNNVEIEEITADGPAGFVNGVR